MTRLFCAVSLLWVCWGSTVGEAALFETAPTPHDGKAKTFPQTLKSGISLRTAVNVDFSNYNGWDEEFDSSNEIPSFDISSLAGMTAGTPVTVVGIGWNVDLQVQNFSWFSESVIKMGDDLATPSLFLQPGIGDDFDAPTPMNYSSGGIVSLSANGLPDMILTDGVAEFEIYELFDDAVNAIDIRYLAGSTITFDLLMTGVSGDFDGDGDYGCADVDRLVAEIVNGTNSPDFDLTGDGAVNQDDLTAWLAEAGAAENASGNPYLPGDANLSGVVDFLDFNIWAANRFTDQPAWCLGDFNASGVVDFLDFNIWASYRFQSSFVPEPSSLALLLLGVVTGLGRRRP